MRNVFTIFPILSTFGHRISHAHENFDNVGVNSQFYGNVTETSENSDTTTIATDENVIPIPDMEKEIENHRRKFITVSNSDQL